MSINTFLYGFIGGFFLTKAYVEERKELVNEAEAAGYREGFAEGEDFALMDKPEDKDNGEET